MAEPIGNSPIISYGTPLAYVNGDEEYYVGKAVGFVLGGGGALIIDSVNGLEEWTRLGSENLVYVRQRYDELVKERDDWKKRALAAETGVTPEVTDSARHLLRTFLNIKLDKDEISIREYTAKWKAYDL